MRASEWGCAVAWLCAWLCVAACAVCVLLCVLYVAVGVAVCRCVAVCGCVRLCVLCVAVCVAVLLCVAVCALCIIVWRCVAVLAVFWACCCVESGVPVVCTAFPPSTLAAPPPGSCSPWPQFPFNSELEAMSPVLLTEGVELARWVASAGVSPHACTVPATPHTRRPCTCTNTQAWPHVALHPTLPTSVARARCRGMQAQFGVPQSTTLSQRDVPGTTRCVCGDRGVRVG